VGVRRRGDRSLAGGLAFGVGMTLAGGCGAGSLWRPARAGEALGGGRVLRPGASLARLVAAQTGLLQKARRRDLLPASLGWVGDRVDRSRSRRLGYAVTWNEETHTLSVV